MARPKRNPAAPVALIARSCWNRHRFSKFDKRRIGRIAAEAPKFVVPANRTAIGLTDAGEHLFVQFIKPCALRQDQSTDWPRHSLEEDNVSFADQIEWRASNPAEAGFHRLAAIENERQKRLGEYRKMQSYGARRFKGARQIAQPETVISDVADEAVEFEVEFALKQDASSIWPSRSSWSSLAARVKRS